MPLSAVRAPLPRMYWSCVRSDFGVVASTQNESQIHLFLGSAPLAAKVYISRKRRLSVFEAGRSPHSSATSQSAASAFLTSCSCNRDMDSCVGTDVEHAQAIRLGAMR